MTLRHATCVDWNGHGILISGESGSGKSDLALRLIDAGADLVADNQTEVSDDGFASAPERLRGLLEVRGIGILRFPYVEKTKVVLTVRLKPENEIDRMPETVENGEISLFSFENSAVLKIKLALEVVLRERSLIFQTDS